MKSICIVYELISTLSSFDPTLEKCLFGAVKLTKNANIDTWKYSGYGIGFYSKGTFLFTNSKFACNVLISGVDTSSYVHVDNKKKIFKF